MCHAVFSKVEGFGISCLSNSSSVFMPSIFLAAFADLGQ